MTREQIVAAIDEEISRLERVRELLKGTGAEKYTRAVAGHKPAKKRVLSADARKRIAMAQKRRWAKQKKETAAAAASAKK